MIDILLTAITVAVPGLGAGIVLFRKGLFYYKAMQQAVEVFHEVREANSTIFKRVRGNPERRELCVVLSGGVKKIKGLKGV